MADLKARLHELLDPIEQTHLLAQADEWDDKDLESLLREIRHLDLKLLCKEQEILRAKQEPSAAGELLQEAIDASRLDDKHGKELLSQGKCGCIVVAGGQASRLRSKGPKGCCPVSLVKEKCLFQLLAERVAAASHQVGYPLPLAIMTSTENRMATETFLFDHHFFGLNPRQVSVFSQPLWPLLSFEGNLALRSPGKLATGPNGNGALYKEFVSSGVWQKWADQGIEMVRVMSIDNPLALPFDAKLIGHHHQAGNDVTLQTNKRNSHQEKAGTVVVRDGKIQIDEYSETVLPSGGMLNIGLYVFSMDYVKRASEVELPVHVAQKAIKLIDDDEIPSKPNVCKLEKFIFDPFTISNRTEAILYPRETSFAPLKNFEGSSSLSDVQEALLQYERIIYKNVTGVTPPSDKVFELDSSFYYPTEQFLEKWQGRPLPDTPYIEG